MMMLEHDAKELLALDGIPVPMGVLTPIANVELPPALTAPWMVKAQIPVGGRGKAGGIRRVKTPTELRQNLSELLGQTIKGQTVRACRIEQCVEGMECYFGVSLDATHGRLRVLLSSEGGVDIEAHGALSADVAFREREAIGAAHRLAETLASSKRGTIVRAAERLIAEFFAFEATLLEVNPLFVGHNGVWTAGDLKLVIDDNALVRQPRLRDLVHCRAEAYPETALKLDHGFDFVVVDPDGEIGLVTTGAGLSMQMLDELAECDHPAFNFCDIRTGELRGDPARLIQVFRWIAAGRKVRSVLINFFAGITHLGEVAKLLVEALKAVPELRVPVTARLIGNGYDEAIAVFAAAGNPLRVEPNLDRAIELALAPLNEPRP